MIIYKVTNKINSKVYIGQTIGNIQQRWVHHCGKWSTCLYLKNSIQKHGKKNFTIEEIYRAETLDDLNKKEEELIIFYDSRNIEKGYNIRPGGNNSKPSEESKERMRISSTGKKHSPETIAKFKMRRASDETKRKMSQTRTGMKQSAASIKKSADARRGKPMSKEGKRSVLIAQRKRRLKNKGIDISGFSEYDILNMKET